ncbi:MAG: hypothetical protein ISEC1_P0963 [Thiomicrorhabdus sp.]|nr:MAG: hypothetical protein ISEC1_P0963 [Thiomicrorhabdus sp.]
MKRHLKRGFYFTIGAISFLLGLIGVLLPLLPTTPFMILAATCFAKSSPRFHQALLNNRWIGKDLRQWEESKTMKRSTKKRSTILIIITFSISIAILWQRIELQIMLVTIMSILLFFIWRIAEHTEDKYKQ